MARTNTAAKTLRVETFIAMLDPDRPTNDKRWLSATRELAGILSFTSNFESAQRLPNKRKMGTLLPLSLEAPRAAPAY